MQESQVEATLKAALRSGMTNMYFSIPCVIVTVHNSLNDQRVDVQPALNKRYKDERVEEQPTIQNVPLMFPASSTSAFSFPVRVGDTVLCIFSQRGMDTFKSGNGMPSTPTDFRRFDKRDAVAIPGLFPFSKAVNNPTLRKWSHNTNDAVLAHNIGTSTEVEIRLKENGSIVINTDADVTVNAMTAFVNAEAVEVSASDGTFNIGTSVWTGDMTVVGSWTFNGIPFDTHKHVGVTPGGGTSGGPTV